MNVMDSIQAKLDAVRAELLDLGLRNPLINYKNVIDSIFLGGANLRYLLIFALLFLPTCGTEEHTETITLGPYIQRCYGAHGERDCLMEYNEASGNWEFFYESIQGFDFEPGFIYRLEVRLEDRGTDIQDVGRYAYHLVKIIEKKKAPNDFSYQ